MTAIEKIQQSAQAGLRNLAASLVRSAPDETAPHKRQPRGSNPAIARDKQVCRRAEIDLDYRYCFRQWRHAKKPRYARRPRHEKEVLH